MYCQLEAIGVSHHGFRRWNATEPTATTISAITIAISVPPFCGLLPPVVNATLLLRSFR